MQHRISRRQWLTQTAALGALATFAPGALARRIGPNEKLNLGIIGTSGRALGNIEGVEGENIVAVCDIDDKLLAVASERFPQAKTFADFRKLIELPGIDGVVISTADHTHAPAAAMALRMGKPVYCEKPLTHTVFEARTLAKLAADAKVATQMGTQIHATDNYRRVVELVRAGAVGPITEVHVWLGSAKWAGGERPTETPDVPPNLHWDLWLGPAPKRPYHPTYLPANWRRWWDFGNGTMGDMACHFMDLPFWALDLRHPTTVEAQGPKPHPETTPDWLTVRYEFPARGDMPATSLTWYDGQKRPDVLAQHGVKGYPNGVLFVGDKGAIVADYSHVALLPEDRFQDFTPPPKTIPASIGHHAEWIAACKDGRPTTCNFDYSGALTEAVLLGNVSFRTGEKLQWDPVNLKATNCSAADNYLQREYRQGWVL